MFPGGNRGFALFILMEDNMAVVHQTQLFLSWAIRREEFRANGRFWKLYNGSAVNHILRTSQYLSNPQRLTFH